MTRPDLRVWLQEHDISFTLLFVIGAIGFSIGFVSPLMKVLTGPFLFLTGTYAYSKGCFGVKREKIVRYVGWSLIVLSVTFVLEVLGVRFGWFFGEYIYGDVLGPSILGVPLIIGFNWVLVIIGVWAFASRINENIYVNAAIAGALAFVFDLIMEPVAVILGFWDWSGPIPVKNYVSWTLITFFSVLAGNMSGVQPDRKWVPRLIGAQFVFFCLLRVFMLIGILKP